MARVVWLGHAAFEIQMCGKKILVDPWLDDNPTASIKSSNITQVDAVYVTHDHTDHLGDTLKICQRTGATFVSVVDLISSAKAYGLTKIEGMNLGGSLRIGDAQLTIVQAFHTSSKGVPTGVIMQGEGKSIYHAGDTALFSDMRLIGELYRIDVALLPIGGYYTMDAQQASEAVRLLNPRVVIPMHYKTFPVLAKSADEFKSLVNSKAPNTRVVVLKPGEEHSF